VSTRSGVHRDRQAAFHGWPWIKLDLFLKLRPWIKLDLFLKLLRWSFCQPSPKLRMAAAAAGTTMEDAAFPRTTGMVMSGRLAATMTAPDRGPQLRLDLGR
jgi:hypothetical protein